jgi:hypothetical protein
MRFPHPLSPSHRRAPLPPELLPTKMQRQVREVARGIDLFLWIDAKKGTCQNLSVAESPHQAEALELLGLPKEMFNG